MDAPPDGDLAPPDLALEPDEGPEGPEEQVEAEEGGRPEPAVEPPEQDRATPDVPPPVVAVVVTHNPGPWLEEVLASLRDQTYPALSVLIIDAGSADDPTPRVASVLPRAYVRRLDADPGFAAAANEALTTVEGAPFLLLCHDDVALDPDVVRGLVEEAFRSNAGVLGPKLVSWDDPRVLRQVASAIDQVGEPMPFAEPGELDQAQHDAVRDVFFVPGACTLVRADLFAELKGYDPGIELLGEDLDLCWRAHLAGARVMVVPDVKVRHREALADRHPVDDRRRLAGRHRIRTLLSTSSGTTLLKVVPKALFVSFLELIYALVSGERGHRRDVVHMWTWNLRRLGQIRGRRSVVRAVRHVSDRDIRDLQVTGSARLSAFWRGQIGQRDDRVSNLSQASRRAASRAWSGANRVATIVLLAAVAFVILGSRNLIFDGIPVTGEVVALPSSIGDLLRGWFTGWQELGLGREGAAPLGEVLLGAWGVPFLGATGALRHVAILACLPLGAVGIGRLARPLGSPRAMVAAVIVYLAVPVPYNSFARASLGGLVAYASAPWLLAGLARLSHRAPFDVADGGRRSMVARVLGLGLLLAVAGAFVPALVPVVVVLAVGATIGSLVAVQPAGSGRMLVGALGAAVVAVVLLLPWSLDAFLPGGGWHLVAGVRAGEGARFSVGDLLRFQVGPFGAAPLGWAVLAPAILPLVIARGWRFEWAVKAWFVALTAWGLLWAGQEDLLPVVVPASEVLLAPAAAALAFAAGLGMAAFEVDLPGYRFGWRQIAAMLAAAGLVVGILPLFPGLVDGRWKMPAGGLDRPVSRVLAADGDPHARILWLGAPDAVAVGAHRFDDQLVWAVTEGVPDLVDRWAPPVDDGQEDLVAAVRLAAARRTTRLGALLAGFGVRYVVVAERTAPTAYRGTVHPAPRWVDDVLGGQLDLVQVPTDPAVTIYRSEAWHGVASPLAPREGDRDDFEAAATEPPSEAVPLDRAGEARWEGEVPADAVVQAAVPSSSSWRMRIDGATQPRTEVYGWSQAFRADEAGVATVERTTPPWWYAVMAAQVAVWLAVVVAWRRSRLRRVRR